MARLFAKVYEHSNYGGQYRWIRSDVRNFVDELGFNDKVSSINIYRGNDYETGDTMRFYQHVNFDGGYLDLGPGHYPNIHVQPYSFGDKISSVDVIPAPPHSHSLGVRLMVRIYEHVNYGGQYRDILLSENNLKDVGFNDTVSSMRVFAGEDYAPGWVCDFFQHSDYSGGKLQPGQFGPGTNLPNIAAAPYSFNDVISSVRIYSMS
ncbi:MAG: hypothetical protein NPIRA04_07690 [Nitrospirales bacterium]|nr:MAG: hypothetical protein NPIRA04_07690 [Nitrospirales bacterium]